MPIRAMSASYKSLARVLLIRGRQKRSLKMIEEAMKQLALDEFGTLEGVEIQYWVNPQTGCIQYCLWRK